MLKIVAIVCGHRLLLFVVALLTLAFSTSSRNFSYHQKKGLSQHQSMGALDRFWQRIEATKECTTIKALSPSLSFRERGLQLTPYQNIAYILYHATSWPIAVVVVILSNFFLLLFLMETHVLMNRMTTPEFATRALILCILWPTNFEMSLGSTLPFTAFLVAMVIRHSLDNQWWIVGLTMGLLGLTEWIVFGLIPLVLYIFWYFHRYDAVKIVFKKLAFVLFPTLLICYIRLKHHHLHSIIDKNGFFEAIHGCMYDGFGWLFRQERLGQTMALVFFALGGIQAFVRNTSIIQRILPLSLLVVVCFFSPYAFLASEVQIAALCMEGVSSSSQKSTLRLLESMMLVLGGYEVMVLFQ